MTSPLPPLSAVKAEHASLCARGLKLNIARGKPSAAQLDLSMGLLSATNSVTTESGDDARNYGGDPKGLIELRRIFAPALGAPVDQVIAGGNSSLRMMWDCLVWALLKGVAGGAPWVGQDIAFLAPVPGYEKHHQMCLDFGIRVIPVPVTADGPDMDVVEDLVKDPSVKGMWCVPTYANPTGEVYSDEVIARLAAMETADDFRLFWDDAYVVHHLSAQKHQAAKIIPACADAGHAHRPLVFSSTSKITFGHGGVGFFAGSPENIDWYLTRAAMQGAGPDKINQLRHATFLQDETRLAAHMEAHRALLAPKFDAILTALAARLDGTGLARWSQPEGGYFISISALPGTAKRAVALAEEAGVLLTVAGSTYPGGIDPQDSNIRIAPSYASLEEVRTASDIIALSILMAGLEARDAAPC